MPILTGQVDAYLRGLRPPRGEVMAEMERLAESEGVPIVHWETGRMLAVLAGSLDARVLEVGTAIGYSALHMAEVLDRGSIVTLERDPERIAQARGFFERAGVADRVEIVEGGVSGTWPRETVEAGRAFNEALMRSDRWRGAVLPVGDGVGLATRVEERSE